MRARVTHARSVTRGVLMKDIQCQGVAWEPSYTELYIILLTGAAPQPLANSQ
jgi:hypothetical protein